MLLDGRPVRTPKGSALELPSDALAQGIADEWRQQQDLLKPREMPMTTIGCTAIDITRLDCGACVERMIPFLAMDTVCFEDESEPLAEVQNSEWSPLRRWFEEQFSVSLGVAKGLGVPAHPQGTLESVEGSLRSRDEWELCALEIATSTAKSVIVAIALLDRSGVSAEDALRWSNLEENFQIERWGMVEGEHDVAHSEALVWFEACQRFSKGHRLAS